MSEGVAAMPQDCETAVHGGHEDPERDAALAALAAGAPVDAFAWLGAHALPDGGCCLRVLFPGARAVSCSTGAGEWAALQPTPAFGVFEGRVGRGGVHLLRVDWGDHVEELEDAYGYGPLLDEALLGRLSAGDGEACREALGARPMRLGGVDGVRFAVWAPNARRVAVVGDFNGWDGRRHPMRLRHAAGVWEIFIPRVAAGALYKYEITGPDGARLPHKADPCARQCELPPSTASRVADAHPFTWHDQAWMAARGGWERKPLSIYEVHAGSWRRDAQGLSLDWDALGDQLVPHVQALGFTHIELLPVHAFVDDQYLLDKGLRNYWGYNSIGFFAPHPRYLSGSSITEFKQMVARMHDAGIEVILDVVYNHTAEGNELGPTLSFKGIDNAGYYRLADDRRYYINDTGTGNTFDLTNAGALRMVMDSLRYWVREMRVDGFRFDLATILGRERTGFDASCSFLDAVRQDPLLAHVKLIAEPWDIGPGGYQLGNFAPGWAEWNDKFRDNVRALWRGDPGQLAEFATRFTGSADLFDHHGRKPYSSVNFVTAHDGFTLRDLVSYNDKHNLANGEDGRDGSDNNISWNHGAEGETDDPEINALRARQMRNLLATLLLSQGTPMLLSGDEFGHSQQGNNNAYCQDNELAWLDWEAAAAPGPQRQAAFVRRLLRLRRHYPQLRRRRFFMGEYDRAHGLHDIAWFRPDGSAMEEGDWHDGQRRVLMACLDGQAPTSGLHQPEREDSLVFLFNAGDAPQEFRVPQHLQAPRLLLSTAEEPPQPEDGAWHLPPRCIVLLATRPAPAATTGEGSAATAG